MTQQHLFIVTGASRGMGRAIALQLVGSGHRVLGISRQAPEAPVHLEQWCCDLADPVPVAERLEAWLTSLDRTHFASASLINNAALIADPGPITAARAGELSAALRVGLEAPLLLSAAFLRSTRDWTGVRRVLHISSGLGRRAMAGTASYCAVKAGLDHAARAMALDEAPLGERGARVVSLAPGVIDTDMQVRLRGADAERFPERTVFLQMQREGRLDRPDVAAAKVIAYLERADFGDQPVADVRDA